MRYAILAAGEGSRLYQEGIKVSKPLVTIGGETLLERLLRLFQANDATSICISANREKADLTRYLARLQLANPMIDTVLCCPPSSMHSLYELSSRLKGQPFCLTTVDTVFREDEFSRYVAELDRVIATGEADGLMGVTDYIDDEKPLYVQVDDETGCISRFLDTDPHPRYVSAGIYGLTPQSLQTLSACIERGESRMRNFQRALLNDGFRLKAFLFSHVFDIDHASDIEKAEDFLSL